MRDSDDRSARADIRSRNGHPTDGRSLAASLKDVVSGMAHLLGQHVALARAELRGDLRALVSASALLVVMAVPLMLGYALGMVALALALGPLLGTAGGFAVVAGGNLLIGAIGAWRGVRRMKSVEVGETATSELRQSVSLLSEHMRGSGEENHVS